MKRETLDAVREARAQKRPAALVWDLESGRQGLIFEDAAAGELALDGEALAAVRQRMRDDRSGAIETANGEALFVQVHNPPLRLILVGAVQIAQALAPMASLAGYDVTIVDPRRAFSTDARFPAVALSSDWPDEALEALAPDRRTAVVTLTHDPKLDDPALAVALKSEAFYIGALGSKRTHAGRLKRLVEQGFGEAELARIHGPVGLPLGAVSPSEIALSIVAQMTQVLHRETAP